MESERSQLRIYLDFNFWRIFCDNQPSPSDYLFTKERDKYDKWRELVRLITSADLRSLKNGESYPLEEYQKVLLKIKEGYASLPPESCERRFEQLENLSGLPSPFNLFFVEINSDRIKELEDKSGYAFANNENVYLLYDKLSFSDANFEQIQIAPNKNPIKVFDHSQFEPFKFPLNFLYYIDPFLSTWSKETVKNNLLPELRYLFIKPSRVIKRIVLMSICKNTSDNSKKEDKKHWPPAASPNWLYNYLNNELKQYNVKIEIIYIKLDQLKYSKKKNKLLNNIYKNIKAAFHDRETYSNYLYTYSGRSRNFKTSHNDVDFNIFYRTKISLKSIFNSSVLNQCISDIALFDQIIEEVKCKEMEDFVIKLGY